MIIGIGTDICDIRRIEDIIERHGERFLNRTFTEAEQAYCETKARPAMSYAKRFAAKEAVAKGHRGRGHRQLKLEIRRSEKRPVGTSRRPITRGCGGEQRI